jgi:hypothetical protein
LSAWAAESMDVYMSPDSLLHTIDVPLTLVTTSTRCPFLT